MELEVERATGGSETLLHGRYLVERVLRRDRLTTVYLARAAEGAEGASLVWSVHPGMVARSDRAARAFVETMRQVEAVTHAAIPSVQCVEGDDPGPAVVATRAPGRTLREQLDSGVMLAPPEVGRMVESVAGALGVLHRAGIVHRAVSPERVLLEPDPFRVWLEEAGFLHALVSAGFITERATSDLVRPGYLLPEECGPIGSRGGDAYALAVLAFEALSGRLPFGTLRGADLYAALRAPELPSPRSFRALLPEAIDAVFERALGVAHGRGYEGPEAFARALCMAIEPDGAMRLTMPHEAPIPAEAVGEGPVEHLEAAREDGPSVAAEGPPAADAETPAEGARVSHDRVSLEAIPDDEPGGSPSVEVSPVSAPAVPPRPALSVAPPRRPSQPAGADEHAPVPERPRSTPPPLPRTQSSLAPSRRTLRGVYAVANDTGARVPPAPRLPTDLTALSLSQSELTPVVGYEALRASASQAERIAAAEAGSTPEGGEERVSLVELPTSMLEESTTGVVTAPAELPPPEPPTQVLAGGGNDATLVDAPLTLRPSQRAGSPLRAPSENSLPVVRPARATAPAPGASRRPPTRAGGELALRAPTPATGRPAAPTQVSRTRDSDRSPQPSSEVADELTPGALGAPAAASELTAALQRGARLLAGATVLSALVATVGLVYAARSVDEVLLAAQGSSSSTVVPVAAPGPAAPPSPPPSATPAPTPAPQGPVEPPQAALPAPPGVETVAAPVPPPAPPALAAEPVALAPPAPPVAPPAPVETPAAPTGPTTAVVGPVVAAPVAPAPSGPTALQRAMVAAQMRSGVADCVMGMEGRAFTLGLRIEPGTGRVSRVRLRGAFNEPPVSTCIEDIGRTVRVPPFQGEAWDFNLVFPIPRGG